MGRPLSPDPIAYPPRGMNRDEAARWIGVSTTKFDELIARNLMPRPKRIDGRVIWDRYALDAAFTDLPDQRVNAIDAAIENARAR
ncbi:hypothetical protein [Oricola sp.]|uniref:helix-turn-helix transcriptional regulator n=1 Tax=Oricola sp. TaxID=1979950 RepID=UPI0025DA47E4|nr:hypothetical protein [Oricola sp.]MCI5078244.1 hypothetical protein [Oricola sp.]